MRSNRNSLIKVGNNNNGEKVIEVDDGSSQNSLNLKRKQAQGLMNSDRKFIMRASTAIKNKLSASLPCCFSQKAKVNIPQSNNTHSSAIKVQTQNSIRLSPVRKPASINYRSYKNLYENGLNSALLCPNQMENLKLLNIKNGRKLSLNINYESEIRRDKFYIEQDFISDNTYGKKYNVNESASQKYFDKNSHLEYKRKNSVAAKRKEMMNGSIFAENSDYQNLRMKRNRKAARMLGFLVAAFSICWLPFTVKFIT